MMRWDQSSLLTATIPHTDSNLLFYGKEETGQAGSSISQVLLNAGHSWDFFFFAFSSYKFRNKHPWSHFTDGQPQIQRYVKFSGSNVYYLPSTQINQQPPVQMTEFQGLETDSGKLA